MTVFSLFHSKNQKSGVRVLKKQSFSLGSKRTDQSFNPSRYLDPEYPAPMAKHIGKSSKCDKVLFLKHFELGTGSQMPIVGLKTRKEKERNPN
jgi:hypothetical protein